MKIKSKKKKLFLTPIQISEKIYVNRLLNNDFVNDTLKIPSESWDRAASINEDGTKLIIDKLTIVANNINQARIEKNAYELNDITQIIMNY